MQGVTSSPFGQWLRQRRKALDLTQEELAERISCSAALIRKIEAGERGVSKQVAEALADYFGVAPEERPAFLNFARGVGVDTQQFGVGFQRYTSSISVPPTPTNLPAHPGSVVGTPLIGRQREIAALRDLLLREEVRLLTLVGPPGTGKTRLSLQVAAESLQDFQEGVYFVPLPSISDPDLVIPTIAQTLEVRETPNEPMQDRLKIHLRDRKMLLVLDNFEQVLDAAPQVVELLQATSQLKVLVTSREALHMRAERLYPVPPLPLPDMERLPPLEELAGNPAIALFVERAQAADPGFALTSDNAADVAAICTRLDGLPLAIELAAARTKIFSPGAMLARLQSRLKLLTSGDRDLPPRQRTLRDTIEWSYNLLTEDEEKLFRCLGVFVGGCTLEAVEAVCNTDSDENVLDGVSSLLDKSLLKRQEGASGEPRFLMLETLLEYAKEKLKESVEAEALRWRHADYFLALAEEAEPKLTGSGHGMWLDRLDEEHDNFRAALVWTQKPNVKAEGAQGVKRTQIGLRLAGALGWFWFVRGYFSEGRQWLAAALAQAETVSVEPLGTQHEHVKHATAKALLAAGRLVYRQGDYASARSLQEQSLTIAKELGNKQLISKLLNNLGAIADEQGDYASARSLYEQSLVAEHEIRDIGVHSMALLNLGRLSADEGDFVTARSRLQEALAMARGLEDKWLIAAVLSRSGLLAYYVGDDATARSLLEQSVALSREVGDKGHLAQPLSILGRVLLRQGEYHEAAALLKESLALNQKLGDKSAAAVCLEGLAAVAGAQDKPGAALRAATLFGASEALLQASGYKLPPPLMAEFARDVAAARAQADEEIWLKAWQAGQRMTLEQAVDYALQDDGEQTNG